MRGHEADSGQGAGSLEDFRYGLGRQHAHPSLPEERPQRRSSAGGGRRATGTRRPAATAGSPHARRPRRKVPSGRRRVASRLGGHRMRAFSPPPAGRCLCFSQITIAAAECHARDVGARAHPHRRPAGQIPATLHWVAALARRLPRDLLGTLEPHAPRPPLPGGRRATEPRPGLCRPILVFRMAGCSKNTHACRRPAGCMGRHVRCLTVRRNARMGKEGATCASLSQRP